MRITPLDVRKQEFRRVVRGLDADEVNAFLATVADEFEAALTDNKQLRERLLDLEEKVGEYRNMERTLRDTLLTAERVMTETRHNAKKEADLIVRDARFKAEQETSSIAQRVEALRTQLRELRGHRDAFLSRLRGLSEAQIGLVQSYQREFEREDTAVVRQAYAVPAPALSDEPELLDDIFPQIPLEAAPRPVAQPLSRLPESGHSQQPMASSAALIDGPTLASVAQPVLVAEQEPLEIMEPAAPAAQNPGGWSMRRFTQGLGEL